MQDKEWLEMLWECGCSVTIQMRLCPLKEDWALARNSASEKLKALKDESLSQTFLEFAQLVKDLKVEKVADGESFKLFFNRAPYNPAIHKAAHAVLSLLNDASKAFEQAMVRMELQFGREVLSNAYSKLSRLVSLSKSRVENSSKAQLCALNSPGASAAWLIDMLHLAINLRLVPVDGAKEKWLDRDRKTHVPGFWPACLVVQEVGC